MFLHNPKPEPLYGCNSTTKRNAIKVRNTERLTSPVCSVQIKSGRKSQDREEGLFRKMRADNERHRDRKNE